MIWLVCFFACVVALHYLQKLLYDKLWDKGLSVQVSFSQSAVFEGEYVTLIEQVTNNKWLPLPYVRLEFQLSESLFFLGNQTRTRAEDRVSFFIVPPKKTLTKKTRVYCSKRGYHHITIIELSANNIFYTEILQKTVNVDAILAVYPTETEFEQLQILHKKLSGDVYINQLIVPDPFTYKGLREYQPFDSFKQINFKAWAKFNEPISNIYSSTVSQNVHIFLCTKSYNKYQRENVYEMAIKLVAFLSRRYVSEGITVNLSISTNTQPIINITSSMGLVQIYEELSKLTVPSHTPVDDFLKPSENSNRLSTASEILILVSSYYDEQLIETYNSYAKRGTPCFWIIPRSKFDDDIMITESGNVPIGERIPDVQNIKWWVVDNE